MTYPDDVLKAAREACAKLMEKSSPYSAALYLAGKRDNSAFVQLACIAIMAERERCAGKADVTWRWNEDGSISFLTPDGWVTPGMRND